MRLQPRLEPHAVPHDGLRAEKSDRPAAGGEGGPGRRVGDVEDGQSGPAAADLRHGDVRRVGADDEALRARADQAGDAVLDQVAHNLAVVALGQQVDVGVALCVRQIC